MNTLTSFFSFKGKISRKNYWTNNLILLFFSIFTSIFAEIGGLGVLLAAFTTLPVLVSLVSLQIRRCKDIGSIWLLLLYLSTIFIPIAQLVVFVLIGSLTSNHLENLKQWLNKKEEEDAKKQPLLLDQEYYSNGPGDKPVSKSITTPSGYSLYKKYTERQDWKSICELNCVPFDTFGTKKELKVLHEHLEEDEVVFGFASGFMKQTSTSNATDFGLNTWLVVLTSERFLCLDHALMTKSVDTQSIRLKNVQAVSASQGWRFGKITIDLGGRAVVVDNCFKESVAVIARLANKWIRNFDDNRETNDHNYPKVQHKEESVFEKLEKLADLKNKGVLTEEEFSNAKEKLLASM